MVIHADAEKLRAETAVLENGRPVPVRLKIRLFCLPVNDKERPVATGQPGQQMPLYLVGKASIATNRRHDLANLDKSCLGEKSARPGFSRDKMIIDRLHGATRNHSSQSLAELIYVVHERIASAGGSKVMRVEDSNATSGHC